MTDEPITLEIRNSHLYPGALGTAAGSLVPGCLADPRRCLVVFTDGSAVSGSIRVVQGTDFALDIGAYITARGTRIPAKSWLVTITPSSNAPAGMRVRKRL